MARIAMCIESGDGPAFERGLTERGFTMMEDVGEKRQGGDVIVRIFENDDTGSMKILLSYGEKYYLFRQENVAPIFDGDENDAEFFVKNPKLR